MKKITIILVAISIIALYSSSALAIEMNGIGLKVGANFATFEGVDVVGDTDIRVGLVIGGFVNFSINDYFSIQPEVLYSMKGVTYVGDLEGLSFERSYGINYLEIPLLVQFALHKNVNIYTGGSIGFYLDGEETLEIGRVNDSKKIDKDDINKQEYTFILGASYRYETVVFDVRYSLGLTNVPAINSAKWTNNVVMLMFGIGL